MTTEAVKLAEHVEIGNSAAWCSAGHHYAMPTACVFLDPGDCEVHICGPCAQKIAAACFAATPDDAHKGEDSGY